MSRLVVGGRALPDALDAIRRYCGLAWSGGGPETWAYRYFDLIEDQSPNWVQPMDVLAASALHPGLRQVDLAGFWDHRRELTDLLDELTLGVGLAAAGPDVVARVQALPAVASQAGVELSLLTKVLHRKRPALVPMLDRAILDRYRPKLPARGVESWPDLVVVLRDDLRDPANVSALEAASASLSPELPVVPTDLRLLDIAVWMDAHGRGRRNARGSQAGERSHG